DDGRYLNLFLHDDALLYSFDEDDEYEDYYAMSVNPKELKMHLSQFENINIDDKGAKEVKFTFDKGTNTEKTLGRLMVNGANKIVDGITANDIKNINKNYSSSYSLFDIHRDMISDKVLLVMQVRTDAHRQATLENPLLLRGAVVLHVGCGSGIHGEKEYSIYVYLFAAQAGATRVIVVEASDKMAKVATHGMVEELGNADHIKSHSVGVLLSDWMGYHLFYESMLSFFVAGFGREGTIPIIDVIDVLQVCSFDLVTIQPKQMDFTAAVDLQPQTWMLQTTWCYGVLLWFETGFTEKFCSEEPVGPHHLMMIPVHTNIQFHFSIVRAAKHHSIDISMELTGIGPESNWPLQMFNLN
ncbi:hypothetical protein Pfo_001825, partial [Paulownia fortunei]